MKFVDCILDPKDHISNGVNKFELKEQKKKKSGHLHCHQLLSKCNSYQLTGRT